MVATGMTPAQVIVAATGDAAEFMRLTDAGTVASGKSGELHRARGESARRHHEHAPHSRRVFARPAHRPLGVLARAGAAPKPLTNEQDAFGHAVWDHYHGTNAFEIIERSDGLFAISSGPSAYLAEPAFWAPHERER